MTPLVKINGQSRPVPPQQCTQVPGFYRAKLGNFEVTCIFDGYFDLDRSLLRGDDDAHVREMLSQLFVGDPGMQTSVNNFLVNTNDNLILVDGGSSQFFGATVGRNVANIRASGYHPEDIDTVLMTHLHPDHVCGLVEGQEPIFPNATVFVARAEHDFWFSDDVKRATPEALHFLFDAARGSLAPYADRGALVLHDPGDDLLAGVSARMLAGHTPGHCGYEFTSNGEKLLLWGDIIHNQAVQFTDPDIAIELDNDQLAATLTRKAILDEIAGTPVMVGGAHLVFPGIGRIRRDGGGYAFVPLEFGDFDRPADVFLLKY